VAKLAGLPPKVVDRARRILETLTVQTAAPVRRKNGDDQPSLFAQHEARINAPSLQLIPNVQAEATVHPVVQEINELSLETLTPMAAFDLLRKWKTMRDA
jgi:DNA mismatch repair ATPase MutS